MSSTDLWEAWQLSKAYQARPSDIYGVREELAAWSFDRAVFLFGSSLEYELSMAGASAKNDRQANMRRMEVMKRWLGVEMKFRDPAVKSAAASTTVDLDKPGAVSL